MTPGLGRALFFSLTAFRFDLRRAVRLFGGSRLAKLQSSATPEPKTASVVRLIQGSMHLERKSKNNPK
jgi:hypothetical protein